VTVAVLCVKPGSHYRALTGVECFDRERDARTFAGGMPVVAHPPCAQWGRLRMLAKPDQAERELGPMCVEWVQRCGGVLEHPASSRLFAECGLPGPGSRDRFGWTMSVELRWWGFPARKLTWLYVVGVEPHEIQCPLSLAPASMVIDRTAGTGPRRRLLPKSRREETPLTMCEWLVDLASRARD
jgi:hypothetical protein